MSDSLPERPRHPVANTLWDARDVLDDLVVWLNGRFATGDPSITAETTLFAEGWINSMGVLQLIAWVESRSGRTIPDRLIRMDYFETPAKIVERFFGPSEEAPS